jgi:hypothetical protein
MKRDVEKYCHQRTGLEAGGEIAFRLLGTVAGFCSKVQI